MVKLVLLVNNNITYRYGWISDFYFKPFTEWREDKLKGIGI
jgi:hypothetical protein